MPRTKHLTDAELMAPLLKTGRGKKLTKKQQDFAKAVADGASGVAAYRKAYDVKGESPLHRHNAYALKQNIHIASTIEAMQRAKELTDSLSAEGLRSFITSELLKHVSNEDEKLSDRLNALKLLGQLSDVAAYTERKEVLNVKASIDIKQQLMEKLKLIGKADSDKPSAHSSQQQTPDSDDVDSLLGELRNDPNVIDGELIERDPDSNEPDSNEPDSNEPDSDKT